MIKVSHLNTFFISYIYFLLFLVLPLFSYFWLLFQSHCCSFWCLCAFTTHFCRTLCWGKKINLTAWRTVFAHHLVFHSLVTLSCYLRVFLFPVRISLYISWMLSKLTCEQTQNSECIFKVLTIWKILFRLTAK